MKVMKELPVATIAITTGTFVRALSVLIVLGLVFYLQDVVLVLLTAIVIASAIEPGVRRLMFWGIPRIISVILVYLGIASLFIGVLYAFIPLVLDETLSFLALLPNFLDTIIVQNPLAHSNFLNTGNIVDTLSLRDFINGFRESFATVPGGFVQTISLAFGGFLSFLLIIVFSFYFSVQERGIEDFLRIVTPRRYEEQAIDLWQRARQKIGLWMQGQLLLALLVGVLVYLGLTILGVEYALIFAALAAILELIPVFGPVLAAVPAVIFGFVSGGATIGFLVIGFYIIIQQFENHLLQPLVVTKVVGVPPLLVILSLVVGAKLAGFLGLILAVPVAVVIAELVGDVKRARAEIAGKREE